jgi:hypothetical protein
MNKNLIYHYTSSAALVNILNNGYLRATRAWQLADGSECRHAIDTLRKVAPELRCNGLWESLETTLLSMPRYVACFSINRNDSHQWKNYGEDGTGACIVFDQRKAHENLLNSSWDCFHCHYDQEMQRSQLLELAKDLSERGESAIKQRMGEFWEWNIQFKREQFSEECEIRFVSPAQPITEMISLPPTDPAVTQISDLLTCAQNSYHHPSGLYDEKLRAFEPFCIQGAISEIILGSRFSAPSSHLEFLRKNFKINQA